MKLINIEPEKLHADCFTMIGKEWMLITAEKDGNLVTAGGRVLIVVSKEDTLQEAYDKAYADVEKITCDKLFYRHDIGKKDM